MRLSLLAQYTSFYANIRKYRGKHPLPLLSDACHSYWLRAFYCFPGIPLWHQHWYHAFPKTIQIYCIPGDKTAISPCFFQPVSAPKMAYFWRIVSRLKISSWFLFFGVALHTSQRGGRQNCIANGVDFVSISHLEGVVPTSFRQKKDGKNEQKKKKSMKKRWWSGSNPRFSTVHRGAK